MTHFRKNESHIAACHRLLNNMEQELKQTVEQLKKMVEALERRLCATEKVLLDQLMESERKAATVDLTQPTETVDLTKKEELEEDRGPKRKASCGAAYKRMEQAMKGVRKLPRIADVYGNGGHTVISHRPPLYMKR